MSLTAEETKTLEATNRAIEAGEDPFGDEEEIVAALPEDEGDPDDTTNTGGDDDGQATTEQQGDTTTQQAQQEEQAQATTRQFDAKVPDDYKAQRGTLLAEKSAAMKQLMDGEIDAEAYAAIETRVADQIEELTASRIRAETLMEANRQNTEAEQQKAINQLIARTKTQVDYAADAKARKQFDQSLAVIVGDPDNAGLSYQDLIQKSHQMVAALRGIVVSDKPSAQQPGQRKPDGEAPLTLRDLPVASVPNANGNMLDQIGRLKGQDYETAFAKLNPSQRRALLDEED
jgi:hypothetical protein